MILAIAALFVFQLLGEVVVQTLGLPLPGPLAGMLLLYVAIMNLGRVPVDLERTANGLLQHLMLLFIPAVTGVMLYFDRVAEEWKAFVLTSILATVITITVTGLTLKWLVRHEDEDSNE